MNFACGSLLLVFKSEEDATGQPPAGFTSREVWEDTIESTGSAIPGKVPIKVHTVDPKQGLEQV